MVTIKCSQNEKETLEKIFGMVGEDRFNCEGFECYCCPAYCGSSEVEVEYQVGEFDYNDDDTNISDTSKLVYISGAITGVDNYLDTFKRAENDLKSLGYEVINPAEILSHLPKFTPYEVYMNMSYEMLSTCNYIYMIDGWEESNGAKLELEYALEHGIEVLKIESLEDLDKKEYRLCFENIIGEEININLTPNSNIYSDEEFEPIYIELIRNDDEVVCAGLSVEHAKWLRDSISEIISTIELSPRTLVTLVV